MSLKINPSSYVIVCKETSISSLTSNILLQYIEKCVIKSIEEPDKSKFDIIWLSHWNSRCDQYTNYRELLNGTYLVDTTSSYGIQCLLFSPSGCDKFMKMNKISTKNTSLSLILNELSINRKSDNIDNFISCAITPPLINFDIRKSKDVYDNIKTCQCIDPPGTINSEKINYDISLFVFIIIGIFIIILLFLFFNINKNNINKSLHYSIF